MQITLRQADGTEKTYTPPFVSGRAFRRTLEVQKVIKEAGGAVSAEVLDSMVDYVCEIYGGKFTRDDFYDGISNDQLLSTITDTVSEIVSKSVKASGVDPNSPNG